MTRADAFTQISAARAGQTGWWLLTTTMLAVFVAACEGTPLSAVEVTDDEIAPSEPVTVYYQTEHNGKPDIKSVQITRRQQLAMIAYRSKKERAQSPGEIEELRQALTQEVPSWSSGFCSDEFVWLFSGPNLTGNQSCFGWWPGAGSKVSMPFVPQSSWASNAHKFNICVSWSTCWCDADASPGIVHEINGTFAINNGPLNLPGGSHILGHEEPSCDTVRP